MYLITCQAADLKIVKYVFMLSMFAFIMCITYLKICKFNVIFPIKSLPSKWELAKPITRK